MLINKIYISGLNMTGKSFLVNLLNGHSCIASYPFHKFGLSLEYKKFKEYLNKKITSHSFIKKNFELNEKKTINIKLYDEEKIYKLNISELILFIINNNGSMMYLFETHFSKKFPVFAGDEYFELIDINFNFNYFINLIEKNIDLYKRKSFELEDLDNIIFNSFLNSTDQYSSIASNFKYYCQATSNDLNEINLLLESYKDIKLIYIQRDLVSSSYAVAKRLLSKTPRLKSKNNFKKIMFNYAAKRKVDENVFFNCLKKHLGKGKLLIVNFEDFFFNKENTMKNISNFLNLKFEPTMMMPHMLNYKINNPNFLKDDENDNPKELFSSKELDEIRNVVNSKIKLFYYKNLYRMLLKAQIIK